MALARKTAVVTGGSRGIGFGIAKRLAEDGASCVLVATDEQRLQRAVSDLRAPAAGSHSYMAFDVGVEAHWARQRFPSVDILVNAAGIAQHSLAVSTPPATVDKVLQTNLNGTIYACQTLCKALLRTRGSVVNIGSVYALNGPPGSSIYSASKAGVLGFTRAFASEVGPLGVRVNAICPGYIETQMTAELSSVAREHIKQRILLGRFGQVSDVAHAVMFLISNTYVTASTVVVDGGYIHQ